MTCTYRELPVTTDIFFGDIFTITSADILAATRNGATTPEALHLTKRNGVIYSSFACPRPTMPSTVPRKES
jgi:hypothetical protein